MTARTSRTGTTDHRPRRLPGKVVLLAAGALSLPALTAHAEVVDIVWQADGRFERKLAVASGNFAELCAALSPGQTVHWAFDADGALNFNIHYHAGKDVRYPRQLSQTHRSRGELAVESPQDYCWMWTNKSAAAAQLAVRLELK